MSLSANAYSGLNHLQDPSEFADDGYGSLMGTGGPKKKKKPVLVLDADELEQAHLAIAMGGQHIMEADDEPEAMERIRMPSSMLGLAPMGSVADDDEDDYALSEEDMDSFADQEPEDYSEEGLSEEEEMEDDSSFIESSLEHLLRPASRVEVEDDEEQAIPSIEEQLKKMRALPIPSEEPLEEAEPYSFDSAPELDEPVAFLPDNGASFYGEPEQVDPASFEPEESESFGSGPEDEPEEMKWEEQHFEAEEQHSLSDEPIAFEDLQPGTLVGNDFGDWSAPEAEAEPEQELESEPEQAPEPASAWHETEALSGPVPEPEPEPEPRQVLDGQQDWSAFEEAAEPDQADQPTPEPASEQPAIEWTFATDDAPLEFAEDAALEEKPDVQPLAEDMLAINPVEEVPFSEAMVSPVEDEDSWDTPEAEWPLQAIEHVDPVELAVPAVEQSGFDDGAPLSFASEELAEVAAFFPEPVPVVEPLPELPPRPQNSLRARVYQMEEERQARGPSLLGRIWQRLFGR